MGGIIDESGHPAWPEPPTDLTLRAHSETVSEYLKSEPKDAVRTLRPIAALSEVIAFSQSVAEGHSEPKQGDRRSLATDVDTALIMIGDELKTHLGPALRDYRDQQVPRLDSFLTTAGGATRMLHATKLLRGKLTDSRAARAAWRDLVDAVRNGRPESEGRHKALVLIEIEESLGHEWRWLRASFSHALVCGDFDKIEGRLTSPTSETAKVAWFAFAHAHIPRGHLRLGQVQFFSHDIWPHLARSEAHLLRQYPAAEFPAELDDRMTSYMSTGRPDATPEEQRDAVSEEHRVLARVELTGDRAAGDRNPWAHRVPPDRWARDLVVSIVEAASFGWGGSAWKLLEGCAVYHGDLTVGRESDPNWSGSLGFHDPDAFEQNRLWASGRGYPQHEPTGGALRDLSPAFAERAAAGDPAIRDAVAEARWYEAARNQTDAAQRIALHVRAFERMLPIGGNERWHDALSHYYRDIWTRATFDFHVRDVGYEADYALRQVDIALIAQLGEWVISTGPRMSALDARRFFGVVDQIASLLPDEYRLLRRRLRDLAKCAANPDAARRRHEQLGTDFDTLLSRAVRQRNAVIHGIRTVPDVVATAEPLIAQLAAFLVARAIDEASLGRNLLESLEAARASARETLWRLGRGESPVIDVIYGLTP
jgi:hypothetical protein